MKILIFFYYLNIRCCISLVFFFFFKQKTAYEITEGDWSSDVCSSDLIRSCHHGTCSISRRHCAEVFQSSRMSWSSKIIALGNVESSQRFVGSDQARW